MIRKHPFLFIFLLILVGGGVYGYIRSLRPKPTLVKVIKADRVDKLKAIVRSSGEIQAHDMVDIQTEVAGVIVDLPVVEGQRVAKGDVLLRIDDFQSKTEMSGAQARYDGALADIKRAEASLAGAQVECERQKEQIEVARQDLAEAEITRTRDESLLKRQKQLLDNKTTSREEYEVQEAKYNISVRRVESAKSRIRQGEAQLQVNELTIEQQKASKVAAEQSLASAKASLDRAQDQLKKVTITSPLDGVIVALNVDVGERAVPGIQSNPQATLMTLANLSAIEAKLEVDETDITRVALKQPVKIDIDALQDTPLSGTITEIGSAPILKQTGSNSQEGKDFEVVVAISNPPERLRVGMSCEAEIIVDTRTGVLGMPIQALTAREVEIDKEGKYVVPPKPVEEKKGVLASLLSAKKDTGAQAAQKSQGEGSAGGSDTKKEKKKELSGVFVMGEDGFAHFRPVKTGVMGEEQVEILEGIQTGDTVITGPLKALRNLMEWTLVQEDKGIPGLEPAGKDKKKED
jgi:HlyD family secretion protein